MEAEHVEAQATRYDTIRYDYKRPDRLWRSRSDQAQRLAAPTRTHAEVQEKHTSRRCLIYAMLDHLIQSGCSWRQPRTKILMSPPKAMRKQCKTTQVADALPKKQGELPVSLAACG